MVTDIKDDLSPQRIERICKGAFVQNTERIQTARKSVNVRFCRGGSTREVVKVAMRAAYALKEEQAMIICHDFYDTRRTIIQTEVSCLVLKS